jgi:chaperonin GroES
LSTFKAIYKRIYRGLKAEFKKIYRLNRLYLPNEEYYRVMDSEKAIARADYDDKDCDIVPVSDPESLTDIQKTMKAELLITLTGKGLNDQAIYRRYMTYAGVENIDELFPDPNSEPQPTPEQRMADIEQERLAMEQAESKARIDPIEANVAKILAEADNLGAQGKIAEYEQRIKDMEAHIYVLTQRGADNGGGTEPAAVGGMVGASGNTSVLPEGGEIIAGGAGAPGQGY